jgi:type IV pilus assembly protein PilB
MRQALCMQLNIPYVDLDKCVVDRSLAGLITKTYARGNSIVPIAKIGTTLTLAMDDPSDVGVIEEVQSYTGCAVSVVTSTSAKIQRAYAAVFDEAPPETGADAATLAIEVDDRPTAAKQLRYRDEGKAADEVVRQLISLAVRSRASDIHIESLDSRLRIRFRIDGVLQELDLRALERSIAAGQKEIVSRIKILSKLDIAERRRPQDGSFRGRLEKDGAIVATDFRVSVIPGYHGENVVIRVLDSRNAPKGLDQIGFSSVLTQRVHQLLRQPAGIILVTGPTGSGKSTTLYGTLMTAYRPGIRVLTAEDPIEYVYEQFSQSEVNESIGNTFAEFLRSFLRHDPEIIMIGEIRDDDTAEMAFRAAQTGHLVLSTLHTNDAVSAVMRLMDIGVEPNLITSALLGVLSQRLVREICASCREPYDPPAELLKELFDVPPTKLPWYHGRGCNRCNFTGYLGRLPVAELWTPGDADFLLITKRASLGELREVAKASTVSMAQDVSEKLIEGRTTIEELVRTLPYSSLHEIRQLGCFHGLGEDLTGLL